LNAEPSLPGLAGWIGEDSRFGRQDCDGKDGLDGIAGAMPPMIAAGMLTKITLRAP
jgi:hypothetical protein